MRKLLVVGLLIQSGISDTQEKQEILWTPEALARHNQWTEKLGSEDHAFTCASYFSNELLCALGNEENIDCHDKSNTILEELPTAIRPVCEKLAKEIVSECPTTNVPDDSSAAETESDSSKSTSDDEFKDDPVSREAKKKWIRELGNKDYQACRQYVEHEAKCLGQSFVHSLWKISEDSDSKEINKCHAESNRIFATVSSENQDKCKQLANDLIKCPAKSAMTTDVQEKPEKTPSFTTEL